ncbi:outer membrane beta-barrel family protein [Algivirga pacifica]|uniref:Outer membrane beta-barrel family protein n=1 Tax=Algivirga pacifica TaxID=1162670 RepID=A0ABP9DL60_9BACT
MKHLLPILLFFISFHVSAGEPNKEAGKTGTVKGIVKEKSSDNFVGYATVALLQNDKPVTGALTKEDGSFEINKVTYGTYTISIKFIGFETYESTVTLDKDHKEVDLGVITLASSEKMMEEVTVSGEKVEVEYKVGKKVINMNETLTAGSTSVTDALDKIPEISVDGEGNVSLRGDSNVRVLIDGKPSQSNVADVLKSLPPESVERVEVITNPSAKYDPEGLSGIVNIVTKRNKLQGINGNVGAGIGWNHKYNGNGSLNYRSGKWGVSLAGAARNAQFLREGSFERNYANGSDELIQQNEGVQHPKFHYYKFNVDYFIDSSSVVSAYVRENAWNFNGTSSFEQQFLSNGELIQQIVGTGQQGSKGVSRTADINYHKDFTKGALELDFSVDKGEVNFQSFSEATGLNFSSAFEAGWLVYEGQVDYNHTFADRYKLETGVESVIVDASSDNRQQFEGEETTFGFPYVESRHSAYSTLSTNIGQATVQAGLRYENTNISSDEPLIEYSSLFPSLHVQQKMGESTNLSFSYSRRIRRPNIDWILPLAIMRDPQNIMVGNQELQPAYTNSFEMGYNTSQKGYSLSASVYTRLSTDVIRAVTEFDEELGVNMIQHRNIDKTANYGVSLSGDVSLTKWWNISGGVDIYHFDFDYEAYDLPEEIFFNWKAKMNSTFRLPKQFKLLVNARLDGRNIEVQSIRDYAYGVNLTLNKPVLKGKGNLSFSAENLVFNGNRSTTYYDGFTQYEENFSENPILRASFSYRFGKMKMKGRKRQINGGGGFM